jgi:hypothetical protein
MVAHDPIDPHGVHARRPRHFVTTMQQRPDSPVSISRQARHLLVDCSDQFRVVGLPGATAVLPVRGAGTSDCQGRARQAENIADRFHWSSPGSKGERASQFSERPYSTASFRNSASCVFLPSGRCSSLISFIAVTSCDAGITACPAVTAARLSVQYLGFAQSS